MTATHRPGDYLYHNQYRIEEILGIGGQGVVYRALHIGLDEPVAIKELFNPSPETHAHFRWQAQMLRRLTHPALPRVMDFFESGQQTYLVMDYIAGQDLDKRVAQQGTQPVQQVLAWSNTILDALDYLHSQQPPIIHRDLKPANLRLTDDGKLYLVDFGLAKVGGMGHATVTVAKGLTHGFAPLEQYGGRTGPRSDIYALGATLYYLFTAQVPLSANLRGSGEPMTPLQTLNPTVPTDIATWIHKAIALRRDERWPTADAMRQTMPPPPVIRRTTPPRPTLHPPTEPLPYQNTTSKPFSFTSPPSQRVPTYQTGPHSQRRSSQPRKKKGGFVLPAALGVVALLLLVIIGGGLWSLSTLEPSTTEATRVASSPTALVTSTLRPSTTEATRVASSPTALSENETEQLAPTETATSTPTLPDENARFSEKDGMIMLWVPAGEFLLGSLNDEPLADEHEKPPRTVYLDAFWIDQTEVTNAVFARFVEETGYESYAESEGSSYVYVGEEMWEEVEGANWQHPQGPDCNCADEEMGAHPVVQISWDDARMYCEWAGRRLPTEAEWEKAARGSDGRIYPWGDQEAAGNLVNYCDNNCLLDWAERNDDDGYKFTAPVGSYPAGASPFGALDMAGNVWEWVADWYDATYYNNLPAQNPQGPEIGEKRVQRGGSWSDGSSWTRSALRYQDPLADSNDERGFRCASSP